MAAPSLTGKYPIVLSDALLQRQASKELFTGVKYSTKPPHPADITAASIKPSTSDPTQFNLTLSTDKSTTYYHGSRTDGRIEPRKGVDPKIAKKNKSKCILIFDAENQRYVLHQLDSEFDMEYIRTADLASKSPADNNTPAASTPSTGQLAGKSLPRSIPDEPRAAKKAPPKRSYEEEEEESSDGGLEIDWGGKAPEKKKKITASALASLGSAMRSGTGTPSALSFTGRVAGKSPYAGKTPVGYAGKSPAPYAGKSPAAYAGKSPAKRIAGKSPVKYAGKSPAMTKPPSPEHHVHESEEEHSEEDEEFEDVSGIGHVDPGSPRGHGNARHDGDESDGEVDLEADLEAEMMREFSNMNEESESEEE